MIVLDVETTGTESAKHSLVSIGAIDFNKPTQQFYKECRMFEGAHVMEEALGVNGFTKEQLNDPAKSTEGEIVKDFLEWIKNASDHTIAGQNPFFDVGFVSAAAMRNHLDFSLPHRIIDLHSIVYYHMIHRGITPPLSNNRTALNSDTIMEYVGIPPETRPHVALNGAKWEAEAFSRLFHEKPLFPEFSTYKIPWL